MARTTKTRSTVTCKDCRVECSQQAPCPCCVWIAATPADR